MQRIKHIVRKEFKQIFRDRMMLRAMVVMPFIQLFVMGHAITFDVHHVPLLVRDMDHSASSRLLLEKVRASGRFDFCDYEGDPSTIKSRFEHYRASVALSIPRDFERDLLRGDRPQVQVLVDGTDSNSSNIAQGYLLRIAADFESQVRSGHNIGRPGPARKTRLVLPSIRTWFNPNLESKYYMLPGIVAILLTMTTSMLAGLNIVREREIGTLEQLNVTPIRPWELILGKLLPFFILSFVMLLGALTVIRVYYGVPMAGSLWLLLAFSVVFLLSTLGLGLFVSTLTGTQQEALFIIWAFNIFGILMSGMMAPIENMPPFVQKLSYLNPVRYYMSIIRDIYLKGSGFGYLWKDGLALMGWGAVILTFSAVRFHKKVD
ncbi:ABC transporter permease [bacterium]|nr:ABC transporter permease [bacterium]